MEERKKRINFRISEEDLRELKANLSLEGKNMSEWLREKIREKINK